MEKIERTKNQPKPWPARVCYYQ